MSASTSSDHNDEPIGNLLGATSVDAKKKSANSSSNQQVREDGHGPRHLLEQDAYGQRKILGQDEHR
ncbi:unnamed protein product [Rotaria sp. Silwood2]|nr:unnamed protein product [Rotaria sp. Silwood2]CAF3049033.1 unnamed protein product [Rotaria sp. Silwood2]CAF3209586.1 unnamed protein product [Rotaria sp. Silwood2]CAF3332988.1 unnamed protein product [Rotaria sp. Silwood2]CAF4113689.1 unnamed protein product [Rotaria sp. Silwood2]